MRVAPSLDEIAPLLAAADKGVVLYTRLNADLETPVSAMLKLAGNDPYSCLLESVEGGNTIGRFSIIALDPDLIWHPHPQGDQGDKSPEGADILGSLRELIADSRLDIPPDLPPMAAGLFGYFGYEMVHHMENLPCSNPDVLKTPDALLMRPQIVVIFDRLKDEMTLVTPCRKDGKKSAEDLWQEGYARLKNTVEKLNAPLVPQAVQHLSAPMPEYTSNIKKADFLAMVKRAVEYIKAGDIFQVVLSQRFSVPFTLPALDLYRSLRRLNPSPFLICFQFEDMALVGSSPEILVRLRDGEVILRPIAGTRPRGATVAEDEAMADSLLADAKERAEHLMLLDLGRNDTGRVAKAGTVKVVESFSIERYSHVMHLVSEVRGRLRAGLDAVDALIAGFPAGTVSGAPKIRAMEIIDECEPHQRGPYAGAAGYISADGEMDMCIILRTAVLKDGQMHAQAGAGIVYDSVPEAEFIETENKAMALLRAAADALNLNRSGQN